MTSRTETTTVTKAWAQFSRQILLNRHQMIEAIRKVRQLHRPTTVRESGGMPMLHCQTCSVRFPCETYEATI